MKIILLVGVLTAALVFLATLLIDLKKAAEKRPLIQCPHCRKDVQFLIRTEEVRFDCCVDCHDAIGRGKDA